MTQTNGDGPLRVEEIEGGVVRLVLARPPANILDAEMIEALDRAVVEYAGKPGVKAFLLESAGDHFSYGASVQEHLPGQAGAMLERFHGLFRRLIACSKPLVTAVRGQCLGGGLELAAFSHRLFASPTARLGQPEIALGVFAPVASLVLPYRMRQRDADDLLLSGRIIGADEAHRMGLVDEISDEPEEAALEYVLTAFGRLSAASLGLASTAARWRMHRDLLENLECLEELYLHDLMKLADPVEGLEAFLGKRRPNWSHS